VNKKELNIKEEKENDEKQANYMAIGMCFGLIAGSVGMSILTMLGVN